MSTYDNYLLKPLHQKHELERQREEFAELIASDLSFRVGKEKAWEIVDEYSDFLCDEEKDFDSFNDSIEGVAERLLVKAHEDLIERMEILEEEEK